MLYILCKDRHQGASPLSGRRLLRKDAEQGRRCHIQVRRRIRQDDEDQRRARHGYPRQIRRQLEREGVLRTWRDTVEKGVRQRQDSHHRPQPLTAAEEDLSSRRRAAAEREPKVLEGCHECHPEQTVLYCHDAEAGARGGTATGGHETERRNEEVDVSTRLDGNVVWLVWLAHLSSVRRTRDHTNTFSCSPIYFSEAIADDGRPDLNELGQGAMQGMHDNQWHLEIPEEYGQMW